MHGLTYDKSIAGGLSFSCILCGWCTVANSHLHGRNSRRFSETVFCTAEYCATDAQKIVDDLYGALAIFSMQFLGSLCTVRPLPLGITVICMDGALANFSLTIVVVLRFDLHSIAFWKKNQYKLVPKTMFFVVWRHI